MHLRPTITIRNFPKSQALETHLLEKIEKLNKFYGHIMHCDVVIEQVQRHKHQGKLYSCCIGVTIPNGECVVNHPLDEDVYVAVRDAFNAMRRKLLSINKRRRGHVKTHVVPYHGHIVRLFPEEGYGFIKCNGSEYYFSKENVPYADFEKLEPGMLVQFIESLGNEGPQANRVTIGKHQGFIELVASF